MSIRRALLISFLSISLILLISISGLWIYTEIGRSNDTIAKITEVSLAEQKAHLKEKVENLIALINSFRDNTSNMDKAEQQNIILDWLESLRFEYGGYYFINKLNGEALIFDGKRVTGYKNIADITDPTGLKIFDMEVEAYNNPEGQFITYLFKKIETEKPESKVSFIKGMPEWGWIIGAGNYILDLTEEIDVIHESLKSNLIAKIIKITLVFIAFALLLIIAAHLIANYINKQITLLSNYFNGLLNNEPLDDNLHFKLKEPNIFAKQFSSIFVEKQKILLELEQALKESEKNAMLKTAFLNNVSHELRTPLNAIVGFSNLLCDEEIEPDRKARFLEIINNSSEQLMNMINEILYISKLESSEQIELDITTFRLDEMLHETQLIFIPQCQHNDIKLILDINESNSNHQLTSDRHKLQQVVNSLVSNALKFTSQGYIKIGFIADKDETKIYVKDSGIGIAEEDKERIFDRFYQAESNTHTQNTGVGLGLNIAKKIITYLGGKIWIESQLGKGSTFFFTIPNNS